MGNLNSTHYGNVGIVHCAQIYKCNTAGCTENVSLKCGHYCSRCVKTRAIALTRCSETMDNGKACNNTIRYGASYPTRCVKHRPLICVVCGIGVPECVMAPDHGWVESTDHASRAGYIRCHCIQCKSKVCNDCNGCLGSLHHTRCKKCRCT